MGSSNDVGGTKAVKAEPDSDYRLQVTLENDERLVLDLTPLIISGA